MATNKLELFTSQLEDAVNKSSNKLTKIMTFNDKVITKSIQSNGEVTVHFQRAKRPKAKVASKAALLGDRTLANTNLITEQAFDTIDYTSGEEYVIGVYGRNLSVGESIATGDTEFFTSQIPAQVESIYAQNDEDILQKIVDSVPSTSRASVDLTKTSDAYRALTTAQTNVKMIRDEYLAGVEYEDLLLIVNDWFINAIAEEAGKSYMPHPYVLEDGIGNSTNIQIDGRLNGSPFIKLSSINTIKGGDAAAITADNKGIAFIVLYKKGVKVTDLVSQVQQWEPTQVLNNNIYARTFWLANGIIDKARIAIGEFDRGTDKPRTKGINE